MYRKTIFIVLMLIINQTAMAEKVPYILHLNLDFAVKEIKKAGLKYEISWRTNCQNWDDGWVSNIEPSEGTEVKKGSVIWISAKSQRSCPNSPATPIP